MSLLDAFTENVTAQRPYLIAFKDGQQLIGVPQIGGVNTGGRMPFSVRVIEPAELEGQVLRYSLFDVEWAQELERKEESSEDPPASTDARTEAG